MIRYVTGDILSGLDDSHNVIICHQVNCQGVMGAGLAKQIRTKWPLVFAEYKKHCDSYCPKLLLGDYQLLDVTKETHKTFVANIFSQINYGIGTCQTSYYAVSTAFDALFYRSFNDDDTYRIPYGYGCGLGGGNWNIVSSIIEDAAYAYDANVEIWRLPR